MDPTERARRKALINAYKERARRDEWDALGLTRQQLDDLVLYLERELSGQQCDHSLRRSQQWAKQRGISWTQLRHGLAELGGYCDCEVILNVQPDDA